MGAALRCTPLADVGRRLGDHFVTHLPSNPPGASQFLAAFRQSDAEAHEKRGTAEPRFASRLATILPLPEGEGRGEGAFDVSLTYQKIEMLPPRKLPDAVPTAKKFTFSNSGNPAANRCGRIPV